MSSRIDKKLVDRVLKRAIHDPFEDLFNDLLLDDQQREVIYTKTGLISKRNRTNYSRRPKKRHFSGIMTEELWTHGLNASG